jgi:hypothetical protein
MGDVEGSKPLGEQVLALKPRVHVFGHTHWQIDTSIGGVRYVQCPLGYPKERATDQKQSFGQSFKINTATRYHDWAESPPLSLVWDSQLAYI